MEQTLTYKMDENGLVEDIINEDGESLMSFDVVEDNEEKEEESTVNVAAIGAGIVAIAGLAILARKPIKKVFKASKAAFKEFKSEMKRTEGLDTDGDVVEAEVEPEEV